MAVEISRREPVKGHLKCHYLWKIWVVGSEFLIRKMVTSFKHANFFVFNNVETITKHTIYCKRTLKPLLLSCQCCQGKHKPITQLRRCTLKRHFFFSWRSFCQTSCFVRCHFHTSFRVIVILSSPTNKCLYCTDVLFFAIRYRLFYPCTEKVNPLSANHEFKGNVKGKRAGNHETRTIFADSRFQPCVQCLLIY